LGTTWKSDVNDTDFQGKRGYIIAANNSDIGSATEMAIVTNTDLGTWQFNNTIAGTDSPYAIKNGDLNSARGADVTFILGSYGAGGAGFETIQMAVTAVPEPSSAALLGLGALALTFRRKK
ncbi:MAG: PEP-CTERM sorting domain-containing protein, partial [Akkermansiaceae bacterium]